MADVERTQREAAAFLHGADSVCGVRRGAGQRQELGGAQKAMLLYLNYAGHLCSGCLSIVCAIITLIRRLDSSKTKPPIQTGGLPLHTPQYKKHPDADKLVVFIHGFMGSPDQFADLAAAVYDAGFSYLSVVLPGHGVGAGAFVRSRAADWEAHVQAELARVRDQFASIYLVGHSMGGLLALGASLEQDNKIAGVFLLATPLHINYSPRAFATRIRLLTFPKGHPIRAAYAQANSVAADNRLLYVLFLKPGLQFYKIARRTKRNLARVTVPVRLVHSKRDETAARASSRQMYDSLTAAPRDVVVLEQSWHAYYTPDERAIIRAQLLDFIT